MKQERISAKTILGAGGLLLLAAACGGEKNSDIINTHPATGTPDATEHLNPNGTSFESGQGDGPNIMPISPEENVANVGDFSGSEKKEAYNFRLPDADGKMHSLSDYGGKPRVIVQTSTCAPCFENINQYANYAKENPSDLVVFLVFPYIDYAESFEKSEYIAQSPQNFVVLVDSENVLANNYYTYGDPANVFIGRDGSVQQTVAGVPYAEIRNSYLDKLVAGEEIIVPELAPLALTEAFNIPKLDRKDVPALKEFNLFATIFGQDDVGLTLEQKEEVDGLIIEIFDIASSGEASHFREPIQRRLNAIGKILAPNYCENKSENGLIYLQWISMNAASNGSFVTRGELSEETWEESKQVFHLDCF